MGLLKKKKKEKNSRNIDSFEPIRKICLYALHFFNNKVITKKKEY